MRLETLAVHAGGESDATTGAVTPPIHLATTFRHGPAGERIAGYEYQREGNPTNDRLRAAIAALEGGAEALTFASGMAAISALLESLAPGSRIAIPDDCYTGLRVLAAEFYPIVALMSASSIWPISIRYAQRVAMASICFGRKLRRIRA